MNNDRTAIRNWVNKKCDQFEDLWLEGNPPNCCDFLTAVEDTDYQIALVEPLLELEIFYRRQIGQQIDVRSFKERFPQFEVQLEACLQSSDGDQVAPTNGQISDTQTSQLSNTLLTTEPAPQVVSVPEGFGRYRIIKTLGKGGMGVVYLAKDTELNREVALKVPKFPEGQNEFEARFRREARAAARLQHRNICPVFDIATQENQLFITMAYIKGRPLSAFINPEKLPSGSVVARTIRKLALALQEAHDQGIVHRDLKPANIMIDQKQEPVVMDFGLARCQLTDERQLTTSGMIIGTPAYMSPEQVRDCGSAGPSADIYSLGVIMYQMLTGQVPFSGDVMNVISSIVLDQPTSPSAIQDRVIPQLERICLKAIEKEPEDRFASMTDFADEITRYLRERKSTGDSHVKTPRDLTSIGSEAPVKVAADSGAAESSLRHKTSSLAANAMWLKSSAVLMLSLGMLALVASMTSDGEKSDNNGSLAPKDASRESVDLDFAEAEPFGSAGAASAVKPKTELDSEPAAIVDDLIRRGAIFGGNLNETPLTVNRWRSVRSSVNYAALTKPALSDSSVAAVVGMFPNLSHIELHSSTTSPKAFAALSSISSDVMTLTVHSGDEVVTTAQIEAISTLPSLFQLHLQNCGLGDEHMKLLAMLPNLVCLDLRGNRISPVGLSHLKHAPMLYELMIEAPFEKSDSFYETLGSLPKIDRLTVDLRNNSDLQVVCRRPLKMLVFRNAGSIDDLSPLIGLPLERIETNMDLSSHKKVLRQITTLETVNGMSRDDFFTEN